MPSLAVVQKVENGKINICFEDNLIQTENTDEAVMAYDKVGKRFISAPIPYMISDNERYIFYKPENPLFNEFFGEFMQRYVQTLNSINFPAKPTQYIGVSKNIGKNEYEHYARKLPLPPLERILREEENNAGR